MDHPHSSSRSRFSVLKMSETIKIQVEALADLLNTSNKFALSEFSDKLTVFAYQNAEEFVNHESFVNLQYNVLLDLIKSNWFYAPEIDILRGVLRWHNKINSKEYTNTELVSNQTDEGSELVASFSLASLIILKTLLSSVRIKQMTAFGYIEETKTDLFAQYKHILGGNQYFTLITEPRQKYSTVGQNKKRKLSHVKELNDSECPTADEVEVLPKLTQPTPEPMEWEEIVLEEEMEVDQGDDVGGLAEGLSHLKVLYIEIWRPPGAYH
uniref:BACK domain-containing protein n=2 Tax=Cacopsylla melanoneura TaxID=428564 RepID=A0A8D8SFA7_9HEMI